MGPQAERPRFPGPLLRRTRGPDPSSKVPTVCQKLLHAEDTNQIKHILVFNLLGREISKRNNITVQFTWRYDQGLHRTLQFTKYLLGQD